MSQYRDYYHQFSRKAGDVARQLAFAGFAMIWLFRIAAEPTPRLPRDLNLPAALLGGALLFDLLQYMISSAVWGIFQCYWERKHHKLFVREGIKLRDPMIERSSGWLIPQTICLWAKHALVVAGYWFLIKHALLLFG